MVNLSFVMLTQKKYMNYNVHKIIKKGTTFNKDKKHLKYLNMTVLYVKS